jgi:hypothetical protein
VKKVKYRGGLHTLVLISEGPKGKVYERDVFNGYDHEAGESFNLSAGGEETEISDTAAAQIAEDHPGYFEIDGHTAGKRSAGEKKQKEKSPREQLLAAKRAELDAAAAALEIPEPEKLPNKEAVVDAILAKKAENETETNDETVLAEPD